MSYFTHTGSCATTACPRGSWIHTDRCYVLVRKPMLTWTDANIHCSSLGSDERPMQLVKIPDNATNVCIE